MRSVCAVLAAGGSERFGKNKLLVEIEGRSMLDRVLNLARSAGEVLLVTNPSTLEHVDREGLKILVNERWGDGISSSVRLAIGYARNEGYDAVVFFLADMPFVRRETVSRVLRVAEESERSVIFPVFEGRKGFPTVVKKSAFDLAESLEGDEGFRVVIDRYPEMCEGVEVDDPWCVFDVDRPSDLEGVVGWST